MAQNFARSSAALAGQAAPASILCQVSAQLLIEQQTGKSERIGRIKGK